MKLRRFQTFLLIAIYLSSVYCSSSSSSTQPFAPPSHQTLPQHQTSTAVQTSGEKHPNLGSCFNNGGDLYYL